MGLDSTDTGGIEMAKKGMARPDWTHTKPRNEVPPVPEIQGKAKYGKHPGKPAADRTASPEHRPSQDGRDAQ